MDGHTFEFAGHYFEFAGHYFEFDGHYFEPDGPIFEIIRIIFKIVVCFSGSSGFAWLRMGLFLLSQDYGRL
jgi:hypothetical protein